MAHIFSRLLITLGSVIMYGLMSAVYVVTLNLNPDLYDVPNAGLSGLYIFQISIKSYY